MCCERITDAEDAEKQKQTESPRYKDVKGEKCRDFAATLRPAPSAQPTQPLPGWSRNRASAGGRFHMFQAPDVLREGRHRSPAGMTLRAISHIQSPSQHVDLERIENLQSLSLSRHAVKRAAERLCVEGRDTHHDSRGGRQPRLPSLAQESGSRQRSQHLFKTDSSCLDICSRSQDPRQHSSVPCTMSSSYLASPLNVNASRSP